ncbi:nuclear transport factor 2 family protein [Streptomyces aurantiacus]|uniref:nuclear transport factor 2 family protein n=1 Tax=Streptomyces aurantiacus TaxID=47760 RepID=UPI0006E31529|nr:nuclear transport factor 2 family protein [Streptomyces aurantiacus]
MTPDARTAAAQATDDTRTTDTRTVGGPAHALSLSPALSPSLIQTELSMLVTALWFEIDHGDGSAASGFFTADAELTFSRRTFRGADEINGVYGARAARGPRVSRHLMSNFHVLRHETDSVEAVSALVLYAQDGTPPVPTTVPVLVADVFDRFVRADGPDVPDRPDVPDGEARRWLIASRRIENRFLLPGDVLAVPTE